MILFDKEEGSPTWVLNELQLKAGEEKNKSGQAFPDTGSNLNGGERKGRERQRDGVEQRGRVEGIVGRDVIMKRITE